MQAYGPRPSTALAPLELGKCYLRRQNVSRGRLTWAQQPGNSTNDDGHFDDDDYYDEYDDDDYYHDDECDDGQMGLIDAIMQKPAEWFGSYEVMVQTGFSIAIYFIMTGIELLVSISLLY